MMVVQKDFQFVGGKRRAAKISLNLVAASGGEKIKLFLCGNALGDHRHVQGMRHDDRRFDDGFHALAGSHFRDEGTVYFQGVDRRDDR